MALLELLAPVFGILLLGYAAARTRWFTEADVAGLTKFVFNVAVPVMLFDALAALKLPGRIEWGFVLAYYLGAFAVYGLAAWTGRVRFGLNLSEQGVFGLGASYSNMVLLGVPVVLLGFGEAATLPLFLLIAFHSALMFFAVSLLGEAGRQPGQTLRRLLRGTARGLALNPIVGGLLLGLLANALGWTPPVALGRVLDTLGGAALPCALFALGAALSAYRVAGQWPQALALVGFKCVLHPLLVWLLARFAFSVDPLWTAVAVTLAAMPVGVNVYLFAERYRACVAPVASAILLSTALSVLTLGVLLAWLAI